MRFLPKMKKGFTLIELLVVIGVLTVLLSIVLVAINPTRQFQQANDTQRRSDVNAILNAIHQYGVDNKGSLPSSIGTSAKVIGSDTAGGQADLCADLVSKYLADLPLDPTAGTKTPTGSVCTGATSYDTGYSVISSSTDNRVTVSATGQVAVSITVTR
jgi:type IV pilus assembly protein PilA